MPEQIPAIEQKVGLIWRKGKYTKENTQAFLNFVRDYRLFPQEPQSCNQKRA